MPTGRQPDFPIASVLQGRRPSDQVTLYCPYLGVARTGWEVIGAPEHGLVWHGSAAPVEGLALKIGIRRHAPRLAHGGLTLKHLGLLGHSAEGAALCFRAFCQQAGARLGEHEHPDVTLDCISFARCMPAYDSGDYASVRAVMETSLSRLAAAGADFFVCPDNTVHLALEQPGPDFPMPGLHIAHVVADRAAADGRGRVGILGTRYTMDGAIYPRALAARGIGAQVPDEADRETVNAIIFHELVQGRFTDASRQKFVDIIERLAARGCDAVALVCTEIPLLISDADSALPVLDSTRLLAAAALDVAVGHRPLPQWRGGPVTGGAPQQ